MPATRSALIRRHALESVSVSLLGDDSEQHPAKPLPGRGARLGIRVGDASALRFRQLPLELGSFYREFEKPLPPVPWARTLEDQALADQLAEDTVQALLGDAQNAEQFADGDPRVASDEMDHTMMGASKIVLRKNLIRFGGEIAIGEVQQFDSLPHVVIARGRCDGK